MERDQIINFLLQACDTKNIIITRTEVRIKELEEKLKEYEEKFKKLETKNVKENKERSTHVSDSK